MTISFRYHNGLGASALGGLQRSRKDIQEDIQSDIVMDIIKANADTISGILED